MNDTRTEQWWSDFWNDDGNYFGSKPNAKLLSFIKDFQKTYASEELMAIDIASGNGRYAFVLAQLGFKTDASDFSQGSVGRIRKSAQEKGLVINVFQDDFTKSCLEQNPKQYDLVVSSGLLEEIDDEHHQNVINGYKARTRIGGRLIIKYCIEISGRGILTDDGLVPNIFASDPNWKIIDCIEEKDMRPSKATMINETPGYDDAIRTGYVVVDRMG